MRIKTTSSFVKLVWYPVWND